MAFACIYIPDFLLQAALRAEPSPRATSLHAASLHEGPLVLLEGSPPLWSVVAANRPALEAGIKPGMTKAQVLEFGPIPIRHRSESQEKAAHAALLDAAWSVSPHVEDAASNAVVLDLEGLGTLFGSNDEIAGELTRRAAALGLTAGVAIASNIEAAILAARGFPGMTVVPEGQERHALSALSIHVLSTDAEVIEVLERWGIETLGALAGLPVLPLSERLGQQGVRLHELANGARARALVLATPDLRFEEEVELDDAVEELDPLSFLLGRLLDQVCARLVARSLALRAVHLRFAIEPRGDQDSELQKNGARPKRAVKRFEKVLTLPVPVCDSKLLLKLVRLQLQSDPPPGPVHKIALSADAAAPRVTQNGLFVPAAPDPEKLELTIARLAKLVGETNVGSPALVNSHRPGDFRMRRFAAAEARAQFYVATGAAAENGGARKPLHGFRAIRPPLPLHVEIREGAPIRVYFRGRFGKVTSASGPWKTSGSWWQEDAWQQNEWDVALDFGNRQTGPRASPASEQGVYRISYDALRGGWFVRGTFD